MRINLVARRWPGPEAVEITVAGNVGHSIKLLRYLVRYDVKNFIRFPGRTYDISLGSIAESTLPQWRLLRFARGNNPTHWNEIKCSDSSGAIKVHLSRDHSRAYLMRLYIARTESLGIQSSVLCFTFFDHGKKLGYHLYRPLFFRIVGPVDLAPESILFGTIFRGRTAGRTLRLSCGADPVADPLRITAVRIPRGAPITAKIAVGRQKVRVVLETATASRNISGHLTVVVSGKSKAYKFRVGYLGLVIGGKGTASRHTGQAPPG